MIPLHVDGAGAAAAVAFQRQPPGRPADAGGVIVGGDGGQRRHAPAGQRRARVGFAGLAQEQAHHAAGLGAQRQTPAGGEIEDAGRAADLGQHGGKPATGEPFLEDPERVGGLAHAHDNEPRRIASETVEPDAIGQAGLAGGRGFHDPQHRAVVDTGKARENGHGEAGGGGRFARGVAVDLVQGGAPQAAGEHAVERGQGEGQGVAGPARGKRGACRQNASGTIPPSPSLPRKGGGRRLLLLRGEIAGSRPALDLGDPTA